MKKALVAIACLALVASFSMAQELKGQDENTGAGVGGDATGGPDGFGYTYADQADGCTYSYVDISGTGSVVGSGDDTAFPVALGATSFDFYGSAVTTVAMATNGYLSTDPADTGPDLSNDCPLPTPPSTGSGARIYPLHDDIDIEPGIGNMYHQYFPVCPRVSDFGPTLGCDVFQWVGEHFPGGAANTEDFQAILYEETWEIVIQNAANAEGGSGSTTGIQNDGATIGLTYACNAAGTIVAGSTAVCFEHPFGLPVDLQSFDVE